MFINFNFSEPLPARLEIDDTYDETLDAENDLMEEGGLNQHNIKKIELYFGDEQYVQILDTIEQAMTEYKLENISDCIYKKIKDLYTTHINEQNK